MSTTNCKIYCKFKRQYCDLFHIYFISLFRFSYISSIFCPSRFSTFVSLLINKILYGCVYMKPHGERGGQIKWNCKKKRTKIKRFTCTIILYICRPFPLLFNVQYYWFLFSNAIWFAAINASIVAYIRSVLFPYMDFVYVVCLYH